MPTRCGLPVERAGHAGRFQGLSVQRPPTRQQRVPDRGNEGPLGLGLVELYARGGGTAERREAIPPWVRVLAGTLLAPDEALRLFGDELPLSETRADLAFRFVVGELRSGGGREPERQRRSQGDRRPARPPESGHHRSLLR